MIVVQDYPPIYDLIVEAFPGVRSQHGVLFAWGPKIFNPAGVHIPDELIAHEKVHSVRQGSDPEEWWLRYLLDERFRRQEEVLAHAAEYRHVMKHGNRNARRRALKTIAGRLSGPLYGRMMPLRTAMTMIDLEAYFAERGVVDEEGRRPTLRMAPEGAA